ncbi:hypothetical protein QQ045_015341 [Rhodiola kirilowii]
MADIIFYVYSSCKPDVFCKIMVALWFMWNHRNRVRHGSSSISPMTAALRINNLHKDFTMNNKSLLPNINNSRNGRNQWGIMSKSTLTELGVRTKNHEGLESFFETRLGKTTMRQQEKKSS